MNFFQIIIAFCGGFLTVAIVAIVLSALCVVIRYEVKHPGRDFADDSKGALKGGVVLLLLAMLLALLTRFMIGWAA